MNGIVVQTGNLLSDGRPGSSRFNGFAVVNPALNSSDPNRTTNYYLSQATVTASEVVSDTTAPVITNVTIANSAHKVGDTVTATITVASDTDSYTLGTSTIAGRSLSSLTKVNDTTYTAEFSIVDGTTDAAAGDDLAVSVTLTDTAGNTSSEYTTAISQNSDAIYANLPRISLGASSANLLESGPALTLTVGMDNSLNHQWPEDITVNLTYTGTATAGSDYTKSDSIVISAGTSFNTSSLHGVADNFYDAASNEIITVTVSSVSTGSINVGAQQYNLNLVDAQTQPVVSLSADNASIAENGGSTNLTASIQNRTYADVTVNLAYSGTATGSGNDYSGATSIVISAGQLTGSTSVTAVDDSDKENDETIVIDISSVSGGSAQESGAQQQTVTINDDEDNTAPTISSITSPSNATYITGNSLNFTVNFSEIVTLSNDPSLSLNIGGVTKQASYQSGSGTTAAVFTYTVESGLADDNGIVLNGFSMAASDIQDSAGNNLNTSLPAINTSGILVDAIAPTIDEVTAITSDGTYPQGAVIQLKVNFTENVVVSGGSPKLLLETGTTDNYAEYSTGSTSNSLVFSYTVQANDQSADLDYQSTNAINLNDSTIKDAAGNNAVLTLAMPGVANSLSANQAIVLDAARPTVSISTDDASVKAGETTIVRFALSETSSNFGENDVDVVGGSLSQFTGSGTSFSALFTPDQNFKNNASFDIEAAAFTDAAGNNNLQASTHQIAVDTVRPTIYFSADKFFGVDADGVTIYATSNQPITGFEVSDIVVTNGTISNFTGSGTNYSAKFTPTPGTDDQATFNIATDSAINAAGNGNLAATQMNIFYDAILPTVTISSDDGLLSAGDDTKVTFTLSETVSGFASSDIKVTNGTLTDFIGRGLTYTATFTPTNGFNGNATIDAAASVFTDTVGNDNSAATQNIITIDTVVPTVTITRDDAALKADETTTVNFTLSEASTDFAQDDVTVTGGSLSSFTGSGTSYSATFTPNANFTGNATIDVAANVFTDAAGNSNTAATQVSISIDTVAPNVTVGAVDTVLKSGDTTTVRFVLSEASTDFVVDDLTVSGGSLSSFTGSGTSYSATFTPTAGFTGIASVNVAANVFTDAAGNGNTAAIQLSISVDTVAPTVTMSADNTALKSGETTTVSFTLSEASTDFAVSDVSVINGSLSSFTGSGTSYGATFTPNANFTGNATLDIAGATFTDAAGNSNTAATQVSISIDTVVPTVTISSDDAALKAGDTTTINFTLSEASTDFVVGDVTVTGGSLSSFIGAGTSYSATFTPTANFTGNATIDIAANVFTDAAGNGNAAATQVSMSIDTSIPNGHSVSIDQTVINLSNENSMSFTFADAEVGSKYTYEVTDGTLTISGTGDVSSAEQQVTDIDVTSLAEGDLSLSVILTDSAGNVSARVTDQVEKIYNQAPVATDDNFSTDEDTSVQFNLLANDTDVNNNLVASSATITSSPSKGQVSINNGVVTYTPNANEFGIDSLKYTVKASDLAESQPATVKVTINSVNDKPVAAALVINTDEDTASAPSNVRLAATDVEDGNPTGALTLVTQPQAGQVIIDQTAGTFVYNPNEDSNGTDSFSYTIADSEGLVSASAVINVNIGSVNDAPVANNDSVNFDEDTNITLDVLANDSDIEDGILMASQISLEDQGQGVGIYDFATVSVNSSGVLSIVPTEHVNGEYSFTYRVTDSEQAVSQVATISLTIASVNDAPVVVDDTAQLLEEGRFEVNVLGNDKDVDTNDSFDLTTLTATGAPNGSLEITAQGTIIYTPNTNYFGEDTFTYSVRDSFGALSNTVTVTMTVTPINDAPFADAQSLTLAEDTSLMITLEANDVDSDNLTYRITESVTQGSLEQISVQTWRYTPVQDYAGSDSFSFVANDGELDSEPAQVSLNITSVNDKPVVEDLTATVDEDSSVTISLLGTDVEQTELTYQIVTAPINGSLNIDGAMATYQPNDNYSGEDSFSYLANDGELDSLAATVSITVNNINDAPVITGTPATSVNEDSRYQFTPQASDLDANDSLNFSIINKPSWANFDSVSGILSGTPVNGDVGLYQGIVIAVSDGQKTSELAPFSITVNNVNDAPILSGTPAGAVLQDTMYRFVPSVFDIDSSSFVFSIENQPSWAQFDANTGALTGTPTNDDIGNYPNIVLQVSDGLLSDTLPAFAIEVVNVNYAPIAGDDNYVFDKKDSGMYLLDVLANDTDIDQDILTISWASSSAQVNIVEEQLQLVTDTLGTFTIKYGVIDGNGGEAVATVVVTIENAALDAPTITAPDTVEVNVTGLFTRVNLGIAVASDSNGVDLPVMLVDNQVNFEPGVNTAYWRTEDSQGNSAQDSQTVLVHPLVSIEKDGQTTEGTSQSVTVFLNGQSPVYPVIIPYTVSGSADSDDHDLVSGELVIDEGTRTTLAFTVFADEAVEGTETIVIELDSGLNLGSKSSYQLTINEDNVAPKVSLELTANGQLVSQLIAQESQAIVTSSVVDPNAEDSHSYMWSTSQDSLSTLITEQQQQTQLTFDPAELDVGIYQLTLTVLDSAEQPLSATSSMFFEVVSSQPVLGDQDSDGDLIPDNQEGFTDQDGDGIPDYLDSIAECNVLQQRAGESEEFLLEAQPGVCLRKGILIAANQTGGAELYESELVQDEQAQYTGGIFDFVATGLPQAGQSLQLVLAQRLPIPAGAMYRKYSLQQGWVEFVIDANNSVASTQGEPGYCPPPGDESWVDGLTEGHWCVQITIEDGGPNDDDGLANNEIIDPSGVAVPISSNSLPLAVDDSAKLNRDDTVTIDVLANDSDADGDNLNLIDAIANIGEVFIDNNQLVYTPQSQFIGEDIIVYNVTDSNGGTAVARVMVTVINNQAPIALPEKVLAYESNTVNINVLSNDSDTDGDR